MNQHGVDSPDVTRPAEPSIAELRAVCQPRSTIERPSGEHWAGRLYMRRLSIYPTKLFIRLGISPDAVTWLMVVVGVLGGLAVLIPGLTGGVLTVILIQLYLMLDCCDGEVARWRGVSSIKGVYLDRVGHYLSEAALLAALGFRAADLEPNGWAVVGLLAALGGVLIKAETDLVDSARARAGLGGAPESAREIVDARVARARRAAAALRLHRIIGAVELSLLIFVASIVDSFRDNLTATRVLVAGAMVVAGGQAILHLISILKSQRLA
jgi:phosphatidylglycerophosphate synthase